MVDEPVSRETFAEVLRIAPRHFQAYCPPCGDGLNTHRRIAAVEWAEKHNKEKHAGA